jgi:signal transduction histidine kinase
VSVVADADERVVHMSVRDTGPGIPDDQIGRIFEPFVQGERSLHRPDEGVGLGLAISRELVAGMGGTLSVASEVGRGSIFVVTLPRVTHPTGVVPGISLAASPTAVA